MSPFNQMFTLQPFTILWNSIYPQSTSKKQVDRSIERRSRKRLWAWTHRWIQTHGPLSQKKTLGAIQKTDGKIPLNEKPSKLLDEG